MAISIDLPDRTYTWTEEELADTLTQLIASDRKTEWIQGDLSLVPSSRISRLAWPLLKGYPHLREYFYGVNPDTTHALLEKLSQKIEQLDNANLTKLFSQAVHTYNVQSKSRTIEAPHKYYIENYESPPFTIPETHLTFDIDDEKTTVTSTLTVQRQADRQPLVLDGENLKLVDIRLDGKELEDSDYKVTDHCLILFDTPKNRQFHLEITTEIDPKSNKALEGLYQSDDTLLTQCEAQGFRRITYSLDRPDVLSRYTTTILADKEKYPVLISNGNLLRRRELPNGELMIQWQDPIPKPSYLFALVAGDLAVRSDTFTTQSGKEVAIEVYVEKGKEDRIEYAIDCLKRAMRWDEERFGREYDLDHLKMVAVSAYNMGAMENKGLLTFNDACLLASPDTATDADYRGIEEVVSHEYFHNWRGNRVTVRNWFELALKEAFTNFTDADFCADMNSRPVIRIHRATGVRKGQFPEDEGPNAHSIRFRSYASLDNYYTATIYDKGAEVIGMLQTILGRDLFRKATDLYFEKYDGKAVTIEELIGSAEEASGRDLTQFRLWFDQPHTPAVTVEKRYNAKKRQVTVTVTQRQGSHSDLHGSKPWMIPLRCGLLSKDGVPLSYRHEGTAGEEHILLTTQEKQDFVLDDVESDPILSINREFSAPIKLTVPTTTEELLVQLTSDPCGFNRYEASQQLATQQIEKIRATLAAGEKPTVTDEMKKVITALRSVLTDEQTDPELRSEILELPSLQELIEGQEPLDIEGTYQARKWLAENLGSVSQQEAVTVYAIHGTERPFSSSGEDQGKRSLRNTCLSLLAAADHTTYRALLHHVYETATNLTERFGALRALCQEPCPERDGALKDFYNRYNADPLVLNKWFALQASTHAKDTLAIVKELEQLNTFDKENPNHMRALYHTFARNLPAFHAGDGSGYRFIADKIITIDAFNPTIACSLAKAFHLFPHLNGELRQQMDRQLRRINELSNLSDATREIVEKTLNSDKRPSKT